jgi:citrate lyase beta subunit
MVFRSFLIIPAIKLSRFWEHLRNLPEVLLPDCIVIDLEDSVPPSRKVEALEALSSRLHEGLPELRRPAPIMVKIDSPRSSHFENQISMLQRIFRKLHAVKIAKVDLVDELALVHAKLAGSGLELFPTIETPIGFSNRDSILSWCRQHGVRYASFGAGDMTSSLLIARNYELDVLKYIFAELVVTCAIHSILFVDSPSRIIPKSRVVDWHAEIARECVWAFANGAKSKTAIHPAQIPIIHEVWAAQFDVARAEQIEAQFRSEPHFRSLVDDASGEYMGTPSLAAARNLKALIASPDDRAARDA